jgi:hypothetical protein
MTVLGGCVSSQALWLRTAVGSGREDPVISCADVRQPVNIKAGYVLRMLEDVYLD